MATPTVSFFNASAGTNSALLVDWMTQLQSMLFAKGWTLEYADADAMGSSLDPTEPAWDKTPVSTGDAGIAVYRMPANDHDTRWYVRLRPGWTGTANRGHMRGITVGTNHDGSCGVTGGGAEVTPTASSTDTNSREVLIAVSEDGFALHLPISNSATNVHAIVERARRGDTGAVTDDLVVLNGWGTPGCALVRAGVGVVHTHPPVALGAFLGGTSPSAFGSGVTLQTYDASQIPVLGPFWPGGFPFFHTRLSFLVPVNDHTLGGDRDITIDGSPRTYRIASVNHGNNWAVLAVATE